MRSVRSFLRTEVLNKELQVAQALTPADEEADFQRRNAINDEWNFEISKIRDARVAKENADRREFILKRLELKKIREKKVLETIEEKVRREKENSATFITRDNIDQAIEQALANPVEYNFSVDLQGTIYKGSDRPGKVSSQPDEPKSE